MANQTNLFSIVNENSVFSFNRGQHKHMKEGSTDIGGQVREHLLCGDRERRDNWERKIALQVWCLGVCATNNWICAIGLLYKYHPSNLYNLQVHNVYNARGREGGY